VNDKYKFRLYLSDRTPDSRKAIENLKRILDGSLDREYTLKILFVGENPQLDAEDNVVKTPTAIRTFPFPKRRITGDFSQNARVRDALGLNGKK
jgi:circadian clock protein KaiB